MDTSKTQPEFDEIRCFLVHVFGEGIALCECVDSREDGEGRGAWCVGAQSPGSDKYACDKIKSVVGAHARTQLDHIRQREHEFRIYQRQQGGPKAGAGVALAGDVDAKVTYEGNGDVDVDLGDDGFAGEDKGGVLLWVGATKEDGRDVLCN